MSNYITCMFFLLMTVLPGAEAVASASAPGAIYEQNKRTILNDGYFVQGAGFFSVGIAKAVSDSPLSRKICKRKAYLRAQSGFFRALKHDINWPVNMADSFKSELFAEYVDLSSYSIKLEGVTKIDDFTSEGRCVSVLYAEKKEVAHSVIDYSDLIALLNGYYVENENSYSSKIYFEICEETEVNRALIGIAEVFGQLYGENVRDVVLGNRIQTLPEFWARGKLFTYEEIAEFELEQLLKLLNYSPYDPLLIYSIGNKFSEKGYARLALLFYSRGTKWLVNPEYNMLCLKQIKSDMFLQNASFFTEQDKGLRLNSVDEYAHNGLLEDGIAKLIVLSFGTLPLDNDGAVPEAPSFSDRARLNHYLKTFASSAGFAEVAKYFKMQGEWELALPFANQASQSNEEYFSLRKKLLGLLLMDDGQN